MLIPLPLLRDNRKKVNWSVIQANQCAIQAIRSGVLQVCSLHLSDTTPGVGIDKPKINNSQRQSISNLGLILNANNNQRKSMKEATVSLYLHNFVRLQSTGDCHKRSPGAIAEYLAVA